MLSNNDNVFVFYISADLAFIHSVHKQFKWLTVKDPCVAISMMGGKCLMKIGMLICQSQDSIKLCTILRCSRKAAPPHSVN